MLALFEIGLARLYNLYDFCEFPYIDEIFSYALHLYILCKFGERYILALYLLAESGQRFGFCVWGMKSSGLGGSSSLSENFDVVIDAFYV